MESEPEDALCEIAWCVEGEAPLSDAQVERAVRAALSHGGRPNVGLSVVFVDDPTLAQMHAEHLGDASETDVISFDLGEDEGVVGELFVSVDRARKVSKRRGVPFERELTLYVVHGALHLAGFDDLQAQARLEMRAAEASVLQALGFGEDTLDHHSGVE